MVQIVSLITFFIFIIIYVKLKQRANQKYAGSVVFGMIDREYNKWYAKKKNGVVLNKKTSSMFEIDKVIWNLKIAYEELGITRENIENYIEKNQPQKSNWKDFIIPIVVALFGTNSLLPKFLSEFSKSSIYSQLSKLFGELLKANYQYVGIILVILLMIFVIILFIWVMYLVVNIDNLYKDSQRLFVLKRVKQIWYYKKNKETITFEDLHKLIKENKENTDDVVFVNLEFSRSHFDKALVESFGNTVEDNFSFLAQRFRWINIKAIIDWILGLLLPICICTGGISLSYLVITTASKELWLPTVIIGIIVTPILPILYSILFYSQLDKYEELQTCTYDENLKKFERTIVSDDDDKNRTKQDNRLSNEYKYGLTCRKNKKLLHYFTVVVMLLIICWEAHLFNKWFDFNYNDNCWLYLVFIPTILFKLISFSGLFFRVKKQRKLELPKLI